MNGEEVEEEFFIITRADNIIVQRGGVVKVPKRGICKFYLFYNINFLTSSLVTWERR